MTTPIYPTRSFIRFRAKSQLVADLSGCDVMTVVKRFGTVSQTETVKPERPRHVDAIAYGDTYQTEDPLDETLFQFVSDSVFSPDRHPELYEECSSQDIASTIETELATEIVQRYKQIALNQRRELIRQLNALLSDRF